MASRTVIAAVALCLSNSAIAEEPPRVCKSSPLIVGQCLTVHGRLSQANGAITVRIWPIGTSRYLGVLDGDGKRHLLDGPVLPAAVRKLLGLGQPQEVGV